MSSNCFHPTVSKPRLFFQTAWFVQYFLTKTLTDSRPSKYRVDAYLHYEIPSLWHSESLAICTLAKFLWNIRLQFILNTHVHSLLVIMFNVSRGRHTGKISRLLFFLS
jgi:hypothetical protein